VSFTVSILERVADAIDCSPWSAASGRSMHHIPSPAVRMQAPKPAPRAPLYTAEQRRRRDRSRWTLVQGILAPLQFAVFLLSLGFVVRTLITGEGADAATASVVVKTCVLYTIMVTGALWERDVFGRYLFAPAFFWEDVFSFLVLALHTLYIAALFAGTLDVRRMMLVALAAYAAYLINATQFVLKLRAARRDEAEQARKFPGSGAVGA
jgi:3-vinyl bacteriochlorophyllide hydratase